MPVKDFPDSYTYKIKLYDEPNHKTLFKGKLRDIADTFIDKIAFQLPLINLNKLNTKTYPTITIQLQPPSKPKFKSDSTINQNLWPSKFGEIKSLVHKYNLTPPTNNANWKPWKSYIPGIMAIKEIKVTLDDCLRIFPCMTDEIEKIQAILRRCNEFGSDTEHKLDVARQLATWTPDEVDRFFRVADVCTTHNVENQSLRTIQVADVDTKWLERANHRELIIKLTGCQLSPKNNPTNVEFAYLDPAYNRANHRHYDTYMQNDICELPYEPEVVLIVENRENYLSCPSVIEHGTCVFGAGHPAATLFERALPLFPKTARIYYWGDLDADGLIIANNVIENGRAVGRHVTPWRMDWNTYMAYLEFGTNDVNIDHAASLKGHQLFYITKEMKRLFDIMTNPVTAKDETFKLRVEQERIPYADIIDELKAL